MQNANGDEVAKGESLTRSSRFGMRRNCDACGRKKRRCDGEQPCSRCVRSKSQCKYSKRRWHHPDHTQHPLQRQARQTRGDAVDPEGHQIHPTPGTLVGHAMLPWKRCRLRASPATGLVGMQENDFLSDFFGCIGFLPLANESTIREAIVKIMVPAAPRQEPALRADCCGEIGRFGTLLDWGTCGNVSGTDELRTDPSFSTFWSAIALGALAKGYPFEAVETYAQLAREALAANRFGPTNAELARASAILTYVYSCVGDMVKFREYLELSECFLQSFIRKGSVDTHAGLPHLLLHYRKVANVQNGPMDSSLALQEGLPQSDNVSTGGELYPFVAQSFKVFEEVACSTAQERGAGDLEPFYIWGPSHRTSTPDDPVPEDLSEAVAAVFETTNSLDLGALEEIADRPSIRAGLGDLLVNGTLVLGKAIKGDLHATLEKLDRSIEVFERYPGMCRCMMGSHVSHIFLATLAAIDDSRAPGMYDRLRAAFNSCRAPDSSPMPPLEEWQGMAAICSDLHCRAMETLIKIEHTKVFKAPSVDSQHDRAGLAQAASNQDGQIQSDISSTSVDDGEIFDQMDAPPSGSCGSNATSGWEGNQDSAGAIFPAGCAPAPLNFRFHSSSQLGTASGIAGIVDDVVTKDPDPWSRSTQIGAHRENDAEPKEHAIAAADWLEVAQAMSDEVYAA